MPGRELITLQFGNYANYVGSHFWNMQDEALGLSGDTSHRLGEAAACIDPEGLYSFRLNEQHKEVYQPRAVMFDLKGSLGGVTFSDGYMLFAEGAAPPVVVPTWGGAVEVHKQDRVAKSRFVTQLEEMEEMAEEGEADEDDEAEQQEELVSAAAALEQLEGGVNFWTDFSKVMFNQRSVSILPGCWMAGEGEDETFASFCDGEELTSKSEVLESLYDQVRYWGEQCDTVAGFQVLAEDLSGFGSLASAVLQQVSDDYSNRDVLFFSLRKPCPEAAQSDLSSLQHIRRSYNEGMALSTLTEYCSLYIPLEVPVYPASTFPHLQYDYLDRYRTAAILGAAVDSVTLPLRLHSQGALLSGSVDMKSLTRMLTCRGGANLASVAMGFPAPELNVVPQNEQEAKDTRMSRNQSARDSPNPIGGSNAVVEGGPAKSSATQLGSLTKGIDGAATKSLLSECVVLRGASNSSGPLSCALSLDAINSSLPPTCMRHRAVTTLPLPLPLPFPSSLFKSQVGPYGQIFPGWDLPPERVAADGGDKGEKPEEGDEAKVGEDGRKAAGSTVAVQSCPVLARLASSSAFRGVVEGVGKRWKQARGMPGAYQLHQTWGVTQDDVAESEETILSMASSYYMDEEED